MIVAVSTRITEELKYYEIIDSNGTIAILSPRKELLSNEEVKELSQKVYSDYENN